MFAEPRARCREFCEVGSLLHMIRGLLEVGQHLQKAVINVLPQRRGTQDKSNFKGNCPIREIFRTKNLCSVIYQCNNSKTLVVDVPPPPPQKKTRSWCNITSGEKTSFSSCARYLMSFFFIRPIG